MTLTTGLKTRLALWALLIDCEMRLLLDTHVLLWAVFEPKKIRPQVQQLIADNDNVVCISMASIWEIGIKCNIGRLAIPKSFFDEVPSFGFELLTVTLAHVKSYLELPLHHRDPFDRMIIAQANHERLAVATRDQNFSDYEVETIAS